MPLTIDDGMAAARIAPELGGMVLQWWSRTPADHLHWLAPIPDEEIRLTTRPKGGSFILAPFSNRIRAGQLQSRGSRYQLEPHPDTGTAAMHGYANRRPWQVAAQSREAVELVLDGLGDAWPWRVMLRQRLALENGALVMSLVLDNRDSRPMPAGLGFHPFFSRTGGQRLEFSAERIWATTPDTRPMSVAPLDGPVDASLDPWTRGRFIEGWSGRARVTFPSLGAAVRMEADPSLLSYLLLFCPPGRPFVCVEPVSHLTAAMELEDGAAAAQGVRTLAPGESLEASLRLVPEL